METEGSLPHSQVPANCPYPEPRNSPHFMETEGSLPHSKVPANCPYPEPARSSP